MVSILRYCHALRSAKTKYILISWYHYQVICVLSAPSCNWKTTCLWLRPCPPNCQTRLLRPGHLVLVKIKRLTSNSDLTTGRVVAQAAVTARLPVTVDKVWSESALLSSVDTARSSASPPCTARDSSLLLVAERYTPE